MQPHPEILGVRASTYEFEGRGHNSIHNKVSRDDKVGVDW